MTAFLRPNSDKLDEGEGLSTLQAVMTTGGDIVLGEAVVSQLRASLRGAMLLPGDDGDDETRKVWNGMVDKQPAHIARCAGVADVIGVFFLFVHTTPPFLWVILAVSTIDPGDHPQNILGKFGKFVPLL